MFVAFRSSKVFKSPARTRAQRKRTRATRHISTHAPHVRSHKSFPLTAHLPTRLRCLDAALMLLTASRDLKLSSAMITP